MNILERFRGQGWVRIPGAFTAAEAAAMRDVVWRTLAETGILRDDPASWTVERPQHLQHLKADPAFDAVGSARTLAAIDEVLSGQPWQRPRNWGSFFLVFPTGRQWAIPTDGWHIDADYRGPLALPAGVKVHAMFGDVEPRSGGMLIVSGSHRLLHRWFQQHPPATGARSAHLRKSVLSHPYLRDLCSKGETAARAERFNERVEEVDGIPLQVLENTAAAGDVILMHPLLLHAPPAAHTGRSPRFLLNKDIYLRGAPP